VVEREPNIRPWKACPKERIAMSGDPDVNFVVRGKYTRFLVVHAAGQFLGCEVNIFATFFTTIIHERRLLLVKFPEELPCRLFRLHSYHTWRCRLESVQEGQPIGNYLVMFEPNRRAESSLQSILLMRLRTESRPIHQCSSKFWRLRSSQESRVIVSNLNQFNRKIHKPG
jgi:hypothetical protein